MKNSVFVSTWNKIQKSVAFDESWCNSTGYYDYAVSADLGLQPGEIAKSVAPSPNDRKIILIATRFGQVVIFERYTPKEDQPENIPVVSNAPTVLNQTRMVIDGAISDDHFHDLVGTWGMNVGDQVEALFSEDRYMGLQKVFKKMSPANPVFISSTLNRAQILEHFDKEFQYAGPITAVYYQKDLDDEPVARVLKNKDKTLLVTHSLRGTVKVYAYDEFMDLKELPMTASDLVEFYNSIMVTGKISL